MTGLKNIDDGKIVINTLIEEIKKTKGIVEGKTINAAKHPEKLKMTDFCIVLINTDFKTNFKII